MDFSAPRNTPVYAASNGKIIRADSRSIGYGKHIRIDHGYGFVTLYAHLNSYNVIEAKQLKKEISLDLLAILADQKDYTFIMKS